MSTTPDEMQMYANIARDSATDGSLDEFRIYALETALWMALERWPEIATDDTKGQRQ